MMNNNKTNVQVTVIHTILRGEQRETEEGEGGKEIEEILAVGPFSKTGPFYLWVTAILTVKVFTSLFCFMLFYVFITYIFCIFLSF